VRKDETELEDELRPEYDRAGLRNGVRGKHLERYQTGTNLALLAPDVRAAFPTNAAVNEALRSVIHHSAPAEHPWHPTQSRRGRRHG
jgi:hypothetical protein